MFRYYLEFTNLEQSKNILFNFIHRFNKTKHMYFSRINIITIYITYCEKVTVYSSTGGVGGAIVANN